MLTDWMLRLRSLFTRNRVEQELDNELRFHLEQQVASYIRQGLAHDDAVRRARLEFGGLDQIKEEHRDARGISLVDNVGRDLQYAARQMRRSPGFAVLAMLCLGLGIGANTAIFGVINSVMLRPMPVSEPERLIMVSRGESAPLSYSAYRDFQVRTRVLSGLAMTIPMESDLDVAGDSDFVAAEVVSDSYPQVLGVKPALGRWFVDDREPVAVISHAIWEREFSLSPHVLGRVIRSESESYTIAGVAPREFTGVFAPMRTDIWVPIQTRPRLAARLEKEGMGRQMMVFGRLDERATAAQASGELNAIDAHLTAEQGARPELPAPIVAEPVRGVPNPGFRRALQRLTTLMAGVVGVVLLIACVNVGNLLLVRGALRQREFAVRRALGASRLRLLRQLLTESLVLAIGGGIAGVVLALWANKLLEMSVPSMFGMFAIQLNLPLDWRVLLFTTIVCLAATVLCGLLPAWRTSQTSGLVAFKGEIGGGPPRRRPLGLVSQVVMSLVLLFVAGSFLQALLRLQSMDPGFEVDGRLYAFTMIPSPPTTPERRHDLYSQAIERLQTLPGVRKAALTSFLPLMPIASDCASLPAGAPIKATVSAVGVGFFDTMGIDIVAGRDFASGDVSAQAASVMVNESLARRLWPGGRPIGERVMIGCKAPQPAIVVGVVRNSAIRALGETAEPHLYRPYAQQDAGYLTTIVLATRTDSAGMVQPVRRTVLGLGQGIRVYDVQSLTMYIDQRYAQFRWLATVLTAFGLLALLLAAIGLYGVIAYRVTLRTQEIGVRMALGATRQDIFREVLRHGLAIVLVGVVIGELLTAGLTGAVGTLQEGIGRTALSTHVAIGLIWIAVALAASYVPAARAARVDPLVALRYE